MFHLLHLHLLFSSSMCTGYYVCVNVCVCERQRERERDLQQPFSDADPLLTPRSAHHTGRVRVCQSAASALLLHHTAYLKRGEEVSEGSSVKEGE